MSELFFNPITIIATLLAAFFVLMAFMRHLHGKRSRGRRATDKPYRIADPYAPPPPAPAPAPAASVSLMAPASPAEKPASAHKFFRQFGHPHSPSGGTTSEPPSDYIWE